MELSPQNHNGDGLLGANSIIVVYMDPLGNRVPFKGTIRVWGFKGPWGSVSKVISTANWRYTSLQVWLQYFITLVIRSNEPLSRV